MAGRYHSRPLKRSMRRSLSPRRHAGSAILLLRLCHVLYPVLSL